jgi:hypothetical protein
LTLWPSALGVEAEGTPLAEFKKTYFRNDMDKWRKVVKAAELSAQQA